jgi:hypothetical protein
MVFIRENNLISGLDQPALEKLANEFVGLDDDDATPGGHRKLLVRTGPSAPPPLTPPAVLFETGDPARLWHPAGPM